ncbi:HAD-IIIA family hydrolase [Knoellia sp. CPCC 206435]|uniref:HAD-IIIA family hydrolase n=1 Tax=Knoellia terrae TaxID=3404797 RepID=UPI003B433976
MTEPISYAVVVPTVGRASLVDLLESLAAQGEPRPNEVVVVDDRPGSPPPLELPADLLRTLDVRVVPGLGRGPAAARNVGWRVCDGVWVCFLDDDVVLPDGWLEALLTDLRSAPPRCAGVQARLHVPLHADRRPTDWERSTAGLEQAHWVTADMAYRREALVEVCGFDERFPRAYREDADLALRVRRAGWSLGKGARVVVHPVRPSVRGASLRTQRGNADDALMRRLHGRRWRTMAEIGRGRLPWHVATTAAAALAVGGAVAGRTRPGRVAAAIGGTAHVLLTADFARRRIAPGPRTAAEVTEMLWTSAAIPVAAVTHRLAGWWAHRGADPWPPRPRAVLFDRDGTLVMDVPYNGDPQRVAPVPGAAAAVARARQAGLKVGVVSNQSGVARGLLTPEDVDAVNAEVEARVGPFDTWQVCHHGPNDGCRCRKPEPGMILAAARDLGVDPGDCVVIGDIGSDVLAARAVGASAILVPTPATRPQEVRDAPVVATDLESAVELALGGARG